MWRGNVISVMLIWTILNFGWYILTNWGVTVRGSEKSWSVTMRVSPTRLYICIGLGRSYLNYPLVYSTRSSVEVIGPVWLASRGWTWYLRCGCWVICVNFRKKCTNNYYGRQSHRTVCRVRLCSGLVNVLRNVSHDWHNGEERGVLWPGQSCYGKLCETSERNVSNSGFAWSAVKLKSHQTSQVWNSGVLVIVREHIC